MKRRKFLKRIFKLSPMVVLPTTVVSSLLSEPEIWSDTVTLGQPFVKAGTIDFTDNLIVEQTANIAGDWKFDEETKSIIYQGELTDNGITMKELYNFMKNDWNDGSEKSFKFPVIREFGEKYSYKSFAV